MQFKRDIGFWGLLLVGIGSIIGSGWLFGPLYASQIAGPAAILTWIVGGLIMILVALTFAELGSAFPVAGNVVQIAQYSHGPLMSFIIGWMVWISSVAVAPVETMAIIQYAANYIPGLVTQADHATVLTKEGIALSSAIMLLMCALNYFGAKFFSLSSGIITFFKLIMPIVTAALLISIDFHFSNFQAPSSGGFTPSGWHGILAALPLGGVIYSLIGANNILQLAGETRNPQKNIPLALIGSIGCCALIYTVVQLAFVGAINPIYLSEGWNKLHYAGDSGPFAGILTALGLGWFVIILYADALISPFGTGVIFTGATARVNYGLSKIGFFPPFLAKINPRGVPAYAIGINYLVGLILFLPFPGWQSLVGFVISCFILSYIIGPLALMVLRKTNPDQSRPFRLPYAGFVALIAFYICNLMIFWTGWITVSKMMIAVIIGLMFFGIYCLRHKKSLWVQQWRASWWLAPYLSGMSLLSFLGTFGGGLGKLAFGWDFVLIGLLTCLTYQVAIKYIKTKTLPEPSLLDTDSISP